MKLVGFNYTKINAEKKSSDFSELKVNTSINIDSIEELKSPVKTKDFLLDIKFNYLINYDPKIANIDFAGQLVLLVDSKLGKEIIKEWKDKKLKDDTRLTIFNMILRKANIRALPIEEELNLPIHINLPSLKIDKKE